ncbi:tetrapyrrole methylase [Vitreoscilla sp. C1]|uniref:SAM-dependent methyltransferase n=1 Tax=Vitreoscilla sp. (strain C1) TaxID=96942 RepID=UPI000CDCC139|nr:SAM-dependent methyltransferase [Vitreoscilla sp. C1]AUZ05514.1 tetrapyrrole methylase [Vitreoscilla sp. C1]
MTATLYLIPTPLASADTPCLLPHEQSLIVNITDFIVEAEKIARAHLKALGVTTPIRELSMHTLNEHTPATDIAALIEPLKQGRDVGLVSEAGCPAVADPGAQVVALAHQHGFTVKPLVGPSSILLAMMASGANGQNFAFRGYLPQDAGERATKLKEWEARAYQEKETQIFIETPYRNDALLETALQTLNPNTRLCVACDLTADSETIISLLVKDWPQERPNLKKRPSIFIIYAH